MSKLSGRTAILVSALAVVVVVLVGWFVLVSPQRSKASDLDVQVATADQQLSDAEHLLALPNKQQTQRALRAAERALPDTPQTSTILRQLSAMVAASKTELDSIGPGTVATGGGAQPFPLSLSMKGQYFAIQKFVKLLRQSAGVNKDKIGGTGRLYSIDSIGFGGSGAAPGEAGGTISATISLNAYVYATPPATPAAVPTTTTDDTATTAAGTTP